MNRVQGNLVDIFQRRIYPVDISIDENGRIDRIEVLTEKVSNFILPPFVDAHIHIESSLLTPENFAKVALRHGTVSVVSDPHEIANVLGLEGVFAMMESGRRTFLKFFWTAPSCVPATHFETSGYSLGVKEIEILLQNPDIVGLGEMMNYPGVISKHSEVIEKCRTALDLDLVIDGHAPGLSGMDLKKYIQAGISTDHECVNLEEAIEKIELGMKILIREGSSAKNFDALCALIDLYPENIMLCSDDLHADDLVKGHLNILIKKALEKDISIFNVLRAVSWNPIVHYKLDVGMLREGDWADFVIVDNLKDFTVLETWINGNKISNSGKQNNVFFPLLNNFSASLVNTADLAIEPSGKFCQVIGVTEGSLLTEKRIYDISQGFKDFLREREVLNLYVKNRYTDGPIQKGLVQGFGSMKGAIATSIAHDSHNVVALGADLKDLEKAINIIIENRGGVVYVFEAGDICSYLALPFGGLMSDLQADQVSERYLEILNHIRTHGCALSSPLMTLSFLSLLVIPSLKLSDQGLFDGDQFKFTSLFLNA